MSKRTILAASAMLVAGLAFLPASQAMAAQQVGNSNATAANAAAALSGTNDMVVFPPANCTVNSTNFLIWDGASNVQCILLPSCTSSQALSYNGSAFVCVDGFAGNPNNPGCSSTTITLSSQPCPPGEVGSIDTTQTVDCTGNSSVSTNNSCRVQFVATTTIQCTPGDIETGKWVNGVFNFCGGPGCSNWLCTSGGLVPD
jgi:hypothetical protein